MSERARYTLLTNISYVVHSGLRLHVSAIVIARDDSGQKPDPRRQQVRMFGPSSSWPICDVDVPILPYSLIEHPLPAALPEDTVPTWRTYDLRFVKPDDEHESLAETLTSTQAFEITTNMMEGQPIAVREFPADTPISELWGELVPAVVHSWHAPYFPTLAWNPVEVVAAVTTRRIHDPELEQAADVLLDQPAHLPVNSPPSLTPEQRAVLAHCFRTGFGELQARVARGDEDDHLAEMIDAFDAYFVVCRAKLGHDRVPISTWETYTAIKRRNALVERGSHG